MQNTTTRPVVTVTADGRRVASTATAWRVLDRVDGAAVARLRQARAVVRERAWLARAELGRVPHLYPAG